MDFSVRIKVVGIGDFNELYFGKEGVYRRDI